MSNYCGTEYYIEGDSKCVIDLHRRMCRIQGNTGISDIRHRCWMTHLAEDFGLNSEEFLCRGFFCDVCLCEDGSSVSFYVESANCPCEDLMDAVIAHYNGKLTMLWFVSCDDEGDFYTNDREGRVFNARYEVDLEDIDNEWFPTLDDAVAWIHEKTNVIIPDTIAHDADLLYTYITNDLEALLGMSCNFHIVTLV